MMIANSLRTFYIPKKFIIDFESSAVRTQTFCAQSEAMFGIQKNTSVFAEAAQLLPSRLPTTFHKSCLNRFRCDYTNGTLAYPKSCDFTIFVVVDFPWSKLTVYVANVSEMNPNENNLNLDSRLRGQVFFFIYMFIFVK